jgi:hypothetical protein
MLWIIETQNSVDRLMMLRRSTELASSAIRPLSNERGGVPSAKKRFPVPNRNGLEFLFSSTLQVNAWMVVVEACRAR